MNFQNSVKNCFQDKYADFSGRATRSEFWYFYLFLLLSYVLSIILIFFVSFKFFWVVAVFYLGIIIPSFAVTARRLHDVNKSGWLQIITFPTAFLMDFLERSNEIASGIFALVTLGLYIYLFILYVSHGDKKDNRFGKNPYKKRKRK